MTKLPTPHGYADSIQGLWRDGQNHIFLNALPAILLPRKRFSYGINFFKKGVPMSQNKAQNSAVRLLNATLMGR